MSPYDSRNIMPIRGELIPISDDLITRFIKHANTSPNKIAIMTTEESITYQQLYLDVIYWKTQLIDRQGQISIICLERSPLLITLLLAMQWLGIPYIPVDPAIPIERLRTIIEDSQAQALIYDTSKHPDFASLPCALLDVAHMASQPISTPSSTSYEPKQTGVAYIIYTSGTTGKPKGVTIPRLALHNFLTSMSTYFLQEEHALGLAVSSISFDVSVLELYLPIWQQKTIFLANQMQYKDPIYLAEILNHYPITFIATTTAFWSMLLNLEWKCQPDLVALCGGEPLPPLLAKHILAKVGALWNLYGPTEATVCCALKQILPNEPITIGHPIHNMEMRVMDTEHRILPPYVKGELFIGGIGLAEGYMYNSDLTHSKFIPCQDALLGRLYQTGDLACTTAEGEFIVFGRTDNQIKLHGYRIELEEIEAQIQGFRGIQECAVTVDREQLIVYICLTPPTPFIEADFIQHLAHHLPEYMLPKRIILLEKLPKTLSGKIDRKSLPSPEIAMSTATTTVQLTPIQRVLSLIWSEELALETVGIYDNFFELGGHSLLATRIIVKIAQQLGKQISLDDLYQAPTIEQFAKIIEQAQPVAEKNTIIPTHVDRTTLPLQDFQLMYWLCRFLEPQFRNINTVARKRFQGTINKNALDLAFQLVLQNQDAFSYHVHLLYPLQTLCTHPSIQFRRCVSTDLRNLPDETLEAFLTQQYEDMFYKKKWRVKRPWISAYLYQIKHDQVELQVCISHMIADEHSISLFFQELSNAYLFFTQHATLHTHDASQYKQYIVQQTHTMQTHAKTDASFWEKYLQDAGSFHFPKQYIMPNKNPALTHIPLSESFLLKLQQFSMQHQLGLNNVICAAISLSLLQSCDNDLRCVPHKLCIFNLKSTRDIPQYDHTIGCFLRLDTLKLDLHNQSTLLSLAKQAQQSTHETALYQRSSHLIKASAIGAVYQQASHQKFFTKFFVGILLKMIAKYFPQLQLNKNTIKAYQTLAAANRTQQFSINVNIHNSFLAHLIDKSSSTLFGLPNQEIPPHSELTRILKYNLDVTLHRNNDQNRPFLMISANLIPEFQKRFGETLISIIEHAMD